jgi:hypothetical protein
MQTETSLILAWDLFFTSRLNFMRVMHNKIGNNEMGGACSSDRGRVYRVWMGKPEGKRPLGRTRRRWEDNIMIDLQEMGCGLWTGLSWALVIAVLNLRVP